MHPVDSLYTDKEACGLVGSRALRWTSVATSITGVTVRGFEELHKIQVNTLQVLFCAVGIGWQDLKKVP